MAGRDALSMALMWLTLAACGTRTEVPRTLDAGASTALGPELCNGVDDDGQRGVDDPFRDLLGRYVGDEHCGGCNQRCAPRGGVELEAHCGLIDEVARCVARCDAGHAPTREGRCAPVAQRLCLACADDRDCGPLRDARCVAIAGESRCSVRCEAGCPRGYRCDQARDACVPEGGSCSCEPGASFDLACAVATPMRMPGEPVCVGRARCERGVLGACTTATEVCDEDDNDCDGQIDEGYRDVRDAYSLDPAHCGQCGVSCLEETGTDLELSCGGDPFAPSCGLACPDARDGVQVGDLLDGDRDIASGCECRVTATRDVPGPVRAFGEVLDENCDGADGDVVGGFYVATDGDDAWPGSPTRPLRSLSAAIARAAASLATPAARPHVYVAAGVYAESLLLADGVQIHGGYRRDFRALDPAAFVTEARAPAGTAAPFGAALVARDVGTRLTLVEGLSVRGLDATSPSAATVGAYLERAGDALVLHDLVIRAGVPGEGVPGDDGTAGSGPSASPGAGQPPRGAREDAARECIADDANVVRGGAAGENRCAGALVSGGAGGAAACPSASIFDFQAAGSAGLAAGGPAAGGGSGGQDGVGPIRSGDGCPRAVCCGLADFTVPSNFVGPRAGNNGRAGTPGGAGSGCADPLGRFAEGAFVGGRGSAGGAGQAGAGGGGGGAGGGVRMDFIAGACEFADGLGGGGGGGGAGGCGGGAGGAGQSGGPSVALLALASGAFSLDGVTLETTPGGRGGPGGAGGDGGPGGVGAFGGAVPPEARNTPTLAGTYPGARGGSGGTGGACGGGGGGCGGASVGAWLLGGTPPSVATLRARNRFVLGAGGEGGAGGGGAQAASSGARGEARDVVAQ